MYIFQLIFQLEYSENVSFMHKQRFYIIILNGADYGRARLKEEYHYLY